LIPCIFKISKRTQGITTKVKNEINKPEVMGAEELSKKLGLVIKKRKHPMSPINEINICSGEN
jgi:hypothetical protein